MRVTGHVFAEQERRLRTVHKLVTFRNSFTIPGLDGLQQPGTYDTVTLEERLDGMTFTGWHRVNTSFRLPAVGIETGQQQYTAINPDDLQVALMKDLTR